MRHTLAPTTWLKPISQMNARTLADHKSVAATLASTGERLPIHLRPADPLTDLGNLCASGDE